MSAYMIDREHVQFLVSAAEKLARDSAYGLSYYHDGRSVEIVPSDRDQLTKIGQALWDANLKSINTRYPDTVGYPERCPGPCDETFVYAHSKDWPYHEIELVQVFKAIKCLEYQACEYDGWEASEAYAVLQAIKEAAIKALPGYEEAEWGAPVLATAK